MKKHILTVVLISGLVCSSLASCTLETYESTTPRSANWSVSTPTNAPSNNVQSADTQQAAADNNVQQVQQQQQEAAPVQQTPQAEQPQAQQQQEAPVQTQQVITAQPPKADPPEVTASPAQQAAAANNYSEYVPVAKNIMQSLDRLDNIAGGFYVSLDPNTSIQDGGQSYSKVTDNRFSTVNDVINYVNTLICGDLVYKYSGLYSGDSPTFKEFGGELYYLNESRNCGFGYQGDPTITSVPGGSLSFTVPIATGSGVKTFSVNAVHDGGTWQACSYNST
jgi:hypothetical protein